MLRALKVDKAERMDVEEVAAFDLAAVSVPRTVLGEKKVNVGRALSIFSPQVEKGENRSSTRDLKDLSERRPNTLRSESANKSVQAKPLHKYNPSVTLELIRKENSAAKENPEFMAPQPRKEEAKKLEGKK
jgi:hypothetical protein